MNGDQNNSTIFTHAMMAILFLLIMAQTSFVHAEEVFALRLSTQPFSTTMCKKIRPDENLRIQIAHHRDLVLRKVPNQFIPKPSEEARKKSYVHFLTFQDLTNGEIERGAIAFDMNHAVIFSAEHPQGLSREDFVSQVPPTQRAVVNKALNTFLRLHKILNAAIDGCRPYPSQVNYGTDDEIDKIEAGRLAYRDLAAYFNAHPYAGKDLIRFERGTSGGFYAPRTQGKRVSFRAVNPLNFHRAFSMTQ
jgi:hypothetical protein